MADPPTAPLSILAALFMKANLRFENDAACSRLVLATLTSMAFRPGVRDIARDYPEVLRACVLYLMRREEPTETVAFTHRRFVACSCGENMGQLERDLHVWAGAQYPDPDAAARDLSKFFILVVNAALQNSHGSGAIRSMWRKERKNWPRTPADFVPYGVQQAIDMLLSWASSLCRSGHLFELLGHVIALSPDPQVLALVMHHPMFPMSLLQMMEHAIGAFEGRRTSATANSALINLNASSHFLLHFQYASSDDLRQFVLNGGSLIDRLLGQTNAIMRQTVIWAPLGEYAGSTEDPESHSGYTLRMYGMASAAILRATGSPGNARHHHPMTMTFLQSASESGNESPFLAIQLPLCMLYRDGVCARAGCRARSTQSGKPFSRCAGCGIVRYCSRECQSAAWRDETSSHKAICLDMGQLRAKVPSSGKYTLEMEPAEFYQQCESACMDEAVTWRINAHLRYVLNLMSQ